MKTNAMIALMVWLGAGLTSVWGHHQLECSSSSHLNRWWYNACNERCDCEEVTPGEFVWRCYRERKEFTCMSSAERQLFIDTYKTIATPGHPEYPQFAALLARHASGFGTIHSTANFLPWHRWFAKEMEDLLRNVDCRVTLPWWDWSKKSAAPFVGSPFLAAPTWLGTTGVSGCVQDGPFDTVGYNPPNVGCLNRNLGGTMPTSVQISSVLSTSAANYGTFSDNLETQIHNTPHVRIGGTMVTGNSPDAPEFFLHHGFIDKLWDDWQKTSPAHLNAYSFSPSTAMPYAMGVTPAEVNSLKDDHISYVRSRKSSSGAGHLTRMCMLIAVPWWPTLRFDLGAIQDAIMDAPFELLRDIPQLPFQTMTEEEAKRMVKLALESEASREEIEQMMRKQKVSMALVERANEGRNIVEKFEDEYSNQVGYDLKTVIEVLNIKPVRETDYDEALNKDDDPVLQLSTDVMVMKPVLTSQSTMIDIKAVKADTQSFGGIRSRSLPKRPANRGDRG